MLKEDSSILVNKNDGKNGISRAIYELFSRVVKGQISRDSLPSILKELIVSVFEFESDDELSSIFYRPERMLVFFLVCNSRSSHLNLDKISKYLLSCVI